VLLRCDRLVIGHRGRPLLPAQTLALRRGMLLAVVGRNGSGKTTFFRTLLGLLPPVSGRLVRQAPDLRLGYMAQATAIDRHLPIRVRELVSWGLLGGSGVAPPLPSAPQRAACLRALEAAGAADLEASFFRDLSEGQKQRVLLARLLASNPDVALLDEPTAAMDAVAEEAALDLVGRLTRERRMCTVVVTHMLALAARHATDIAWFDRDAGRVVQGPPAAVFADAGFRQQFGELEIPGAHPRPTSTPEPAP
jgi:zinc transport system ATP-binding protein